MVNIAEKVPYDLKDCISRHISLVGAEKKWGPCLSPSPARVIRFDLDWRWIKEVDSGLFFHLEIEEKQVLRPPF